jgi:hypothetical protein
MAIAVHTNEQCENRSEYVHGSIVAVSLSSLVFADLITQIQISGGGAVVTSVSPK